MEGRLGTVEFSGLEDDHVAKFLEEELRELLDTLHHPFLRPPTPTRLTHRHANTHKPFQ